MPLGAYPQRIKDFQKWATKKVGQGNISDRVTGASRPRPQFRRKRRRRKKKVEDA